MARRRKNLKAPKHRNLRMNDDVYKLRRKVINCIYEAKALLNGDMPRVDVRITECSDPRTLGSARMGDCIVWIPADKIGNDQVKLRGTVFHELLHAIYSQPHVEGCKLMDAVFKPTTVEEQDKLFLKYAKKNRTANRAA